MLPSLWIANGATATIALFTASLGPLFFQGNEDDICKSLTISNVQCTFGAEPKYPSLSHCPASLSPTPPPFLFPDFTCFFCPCLSKSQTQAPAAQLVCLTVGQSTGILTVCPYLLLPEKTPCLFPNSCPSLSLYLSIGMKKANLIILQTFVLQLWY